MSKAKTFTARPIEVEAMKVQKPWKRVIEWSGAIPVYEPSGRALAWLALSTIDGEEHVDVGDWIVRREGHPYPVVLNDKDFNELYEESK